MEVPHTAISGMESELVPSGRPCSRSWPRNAARPANGTSASWRSWNWCPWTRRRPAGREVDGAARSRAGRPWRGPFWRRPCSIYRRPVRWSSGCEPTRLCGWESACAVPSEGTFSRAFAGCAASELAGRLLHEALVGRLLEGRLAGYVSRDSTAIPAHEQPVCKSKKAQPKRKRGRPRKGEERAPEPTRLRRQGSMTLEAMPEDLPTVCDTG